MNKSQSKYKSTAIKMDEALLKLLEKKDYSYITVKEICMISEVNRSTFYLHYDTIDELLFETAEYVNMRFNSYFEHLNLDYDKIKNFKKENLIFITPEFLIPWLKFIKENKILYKTVFKQFEFLPIVKNTFNEIKKTMNMIFEKYNIIEKNRKYIMMYYLEGINAIVKEWVKCDCVDEITEIVKIIKECVRPL